MNRNCTPNLRSVNPNSQLVADPASEVAVMDVPRLMFGAVSTNWLNLYAQSMGTELLGAAGQRPMTAIQPTLPNNKGNTALMRVYQSALGTAVISNNSSATLSNAPIQGVSAMAMSSETFMPPVAQGAKLTNTGTGFAYSVDTNGSIEPGYGAVQTRDLGFTSILRSPVTAPSELQSGFSGN